MGGFKCSFKHCRNYSKNFKMFVVPKVHRHSINIRHNQLQDQRRKAWLKVLNLKDDPQILPKRLKVCSSHFSSGNPAQLHEIDNIDWVPTINICCQSDQTQKSGKSRRKSNGNSGSAVVRNKSAFDANKTISPDFFNNMPLLRSLGTQTETDELNEEIIDDDISAPAVSLDGRSGILRQSCGVQTVDYLLNDVICLRRTIKELTQQLKSSEEESEDLRKKVEYQSKKLINLKMENIKLSASIAN